MGFLAAVRDYDAKLPALAAARDAASGPALEKAAKAVATNRALRFNNALDLAVTGTFLSLAAVLVVMGVAEWLRLLSGSRTPDLRESEPTWLPESIAGPRPGVAPAGAAAIALALARNWSGQDAVDRAAADPAVCAAQRVLVDVPEVRAEVEERRRADAYVAEAERRFDGSPRCC